MMMMMMMIDTTTITWHRAPLLYAHFQVCFCHNLIVIVVVVAILVSIGALESTRRGPSMTRRELTNEMIVRDPESFASCGSRSMIINCQTREGIARSFLV
jgi:hypothetical protein